MRRLLWLLGITAYAVAEIWVLSLLANYIGIGGVVLLLVLEFGIGVLIVRRAGISAVRSLNDSLVAGEQQAGRAAASSGLMALGGILIAIPGVLTDLLGLLLLIPPVRRWVARVSGRAISRRVERYVGPVSPAGFTRGDDTIVVTSVVRDDDSPVTRPPAQLTDTDTDEGND